MSPRECPGKFLARWVLTMAMLFQATDRVDAQSPPPPPGPPTLIRGQILLPTRPTTVTFKIKKSGSEVVSSGAILPESVDGADYYSAQLPAFDQTQPNLQLEALVNDQTSAVATMNLADARAIPGVLHIEEDQFVVPRAQFIVARASYVASSSARKLQLTAVLAPTHSGNEYLTTTNGSGSASSPQAGVIRWIARDDAGRLIVDEKETLSLKKDSITVSRITVSDSRGELANIPVLEATWSPTPTTGPRVNSRVPLWIHSNMGTDHLGPGHLGSGQIPPTVQTGCTSNAKPASFALDQGDYLLADLSLPSTVNVTPGYLDHFALVVNQCSSGTNPVTATYPLSDSRTVTWTRDGETWVSGQWLVTVSVSESGVEHVGLQGPSPPDPRWNLHFLNTGTAVEPPSTSL